MNNPVFRRAAFAALVCLATSAPAFAAGGVWDSALAVTGSAGTGSGATSATPWIGSPIAGSRYAEWNFFDAYPTDTTADIANNAGTNGVVTENSGAAFLTGGGNIYSFAAPTDFTITTTGLGGVANVWLRTGTMGTLPVASASLNGVAASAIETFSASLGGFGGDEKEWYWKWSNVNAASYSFNLTATGSSMSLDQVGVFAALAPVPEPGEWAMLVAALGLMGAMVRRRQKRHQA